MLQSAHVLGHQIHVIVVDATLMSGVEVIPKLLELE